MTLPITEGRLDPLPDWLTAQPARAVIAALEAAGGLGCARFVGGCVRDTLLCRADQVTDVDIATPLTPSQVTAALEAAGLRAIPTGIEHGTITALSGGRTYEVTTLRRDVETDGRRAVVAFTDDWGEDAARRDFGLNALYADPDGTLHDPTGGGLDDVVARRIVFVGDPETRIREDYLRILRFFRFLARVGDAAQADPAGLAACAKLKDGIAGLSGERVQQELFKLLGAPNPVPAVRLMAAAGVLGEVIPQFRETGLFTELVASDALADEISDPLLRLAGLIGQASGAETAKQLRMSNEDRNRLLACTSGFGRFTQDMADADARRAIHRMGRPAYRDQIRLSWAYQPQDPSDWKRLLDLSDWSPPPFPLSGEDIMALGVPEGPGVGAVRKAVEQWWIDGDLRATPEQALAFARTVAANLPS